MVAGEVPSSARSATYHGAAPSDRRLVHRTRLTGTGALGIAHRRRSVRMRRARPTWRGLHNESPDGAGTGAAGAFLARSAELTAEPDRRAAPNAGKRVGRGPTRLLDAD